MTQRLSSDERARIEAMRAAGLSVDEVAWCLGRHRSTVYRELDRNSGRGGYDAGAAQAAADARAARSKTPKLAADAELTQAVGEGLAMRWSPQAVCADLRARGFRLCAGRRRDGFGAFWSAACVERELTPIDPVALVERFCETEREPVTADVRRQTR